MTPMEKMAEVVRALEWAKRTGRLEYTRRTNFNGDYCDGVDAFDRALTLARKLRENAVEGWVHPESTGLVHSYTSADFFLERPHNEYCAALLILSDPIP